MNERMTPTAGCTKCGSRNLPTIGHEPCPGAPTKAKIKSRDKIQLQLGNNRTALFQLDLSPREAADLGHELLAHGWALLFGSTAKGDSEVEL